jgi:lysophospholipase L1-like esterase
MFYNEEDTAHRIKEVINHILAKMPNIKILLLGIISRLGDLEEKIEATNAIISKFNDGKHVFYLHMSNAFQDSPGKEKAGLYADTVHPSAMRYLVWYQNMESLLQKLLK